MTEPREDIAIEQAQEPRKTGRRPFFTLVSFAALFLIPPITTGAIMITVLLNPGFYTGILKQGRFITAFVEGKTWEQEKRINEEVERELQYSRYAQELDSARSLYERAVETYTRLRQDDEFDSLETERKDLKRLDWDDARLTFPDKDAFTRYRDDEIGRIDERLAAIKNRRAENRDRISDAEKEMLRLRKEYDTALSTLDRKDKEAKKIAERHTDTATGSIYADLELIEGPLAKIVNEKLFDGAVREAIVKILSFITSYDRQIEQRNIYYVRSAYDGPFGRRSLRVRIPNIAISLWVDEGPDGVARKKHVLSHLLVEEMKQIEGIQNRLLLMTLFRFSDTRLGEYFGGKFLGGLGLTLQGGVIRLSNLVLKDETAEIASGVMCALSWGRYAAYGAAGVLILFLLYLFFSTAERRRKMIALKRLFIYPSVLIIAACGTLIWASLNIFSYYPGFLEDLSARSYVKHLGFTAAWHFVAPMLIVFGNLLVAGLLIRKRLASTKNVGPPVKKREMNKSRV